MPPAVLLVFAVFCNMATTEELGGCSPAVWAVLWYMPIITLVDIETGM